MSGRASSAVGGERWDLPVDDLTAPHHVHVQSIVRATTSGALGEHEGIGILEQLAIGRHVPTGLEGIFDGLNRVLTARTGAGNQDGRQVWRMVMPPSTANHGAVDELDDRQAEVEGHVGDLLRVAVAAKRHPPAGVGVLGIQGRFRRSCRCRSGPDRCS